MKTYTMLLGLALTLIFASVAQAWPGKVILKGNSVYWGQYTNLTSVIALTPEPGQDLALSIRNYPVNGVSAVLLTAQTPDHPFFASDGQTINADDQKTMQHNLDVINGLDMLPIVVLFDPACPLASPAAYEAAAATFQQTFNKENWFLLCVSDRCDDPAFKDGAALAKNVAAAVHKVDAKQVMAAGASTPAVNKQILQDKDGVKVIVAHAAKPGSAIAGIQAPAIETLESQALSGDALNTALTTVFDKGPGFAILDGANAPQWLPVLFEAIDAYQKSHYTAMPPDPNDTFSLKPGEKEEGFVSLFNGKDLSGWVQITKPGEFIVEDGVIKMVGPSSGWARSWKPYKDFVFRGEFKIKEDGNNGFWFRTTPVGRNSRTGFELQIYGDPAQFTPTTESCGALYDIRPPDAHVMKPGDWNEYEVTCKGDEITIKWNGQIVHHVLYTELDPLKNRTRQGFFGLTQHHALAEYRNLRIKELE